VTGKQVKLFLVDGKPGGLTTAEITNWTGQIVLGPRSDLAALLRRDETTKTGAYMLLGDDEAALGGVRCYIGEADVVAERLRAHQRAKNWWDRVVVITSKDENLTKAHGRYLEARLIALAEQAGRVELDNNTKPPSPALPEADIAAMDDFVAQLQIVLPVLGVNAIRVRDTKPATRADDSENSSPTFHLANAKLRVQASARQIDGEFTLLAGSTVAGEVRESTKYSASTAKAYAALRARLNKCITDGSVVVENGVGVVKRDVVFSSPSTAGSIVLGRSCNGRTSWISKTGETFGQWEGRGVEQALFP
jgi:hypothetical protein